MENINHTEIIKLFQKYSPYVSFLSKKYYIKGGTKDDLFQEGIIGILEACKNYKGESTSDKKFDSFVKICIKREMLDAIRTSNAQKNKVLNESVSYTNYNDDGDEMSILDIVMDRNFSNDPLDIFIDREKFQEKIKICEKELNDFEKEVLKHYLSGMKQSEIAKSLDKGVKVIDNTLQRIKTKVKEK
ncbi:MAG: sigma-70 family RNA polymerase sigma factor [Clostridia bacterium]|nr:sigma-70 family RNA polymerase sigma factor [Clostridia bacterium]